MRLLAFIIFCCFFGSFRNSTLAIFSIFVMPFSFLSKDKYVHDSVMDLAMAFVTESHNIASICPPSKLVIKRVMSFRMVLASTDLTDTQITLSSFSLCFHMAAISFSQFHTFLSCDD